MVEVEVGEGVAVFWSVRTIDLIVPLGTTKEAHDMGEAGASWGVRADSHSLVGRVRIIGSVARWVHVLALVFIYEAGDDVVKSKFTVGCRIKRNKE